QITVPFKKLNENIVYRFIKFWFSSGFSLRKAHCLCPALALVFLFYGKWPKTKNVACPDAQVRPLRLVPTREQRIGAANADALYVWLATEQDLKVHLVRIIDTNATEHVSRNFFLKTFAKSPAGRDDISLDEALHQFVKSW